MNSEVSAIIPLYNKEHDIAAAIDSILSQSLPVCEIIVIDDGSTDGGVEIVRSYNSPLIKIISQQNAGVSAARNKGAQEAKGKYLAFLDGDDRWQPTYIEKIAQLIKQYPNCGAYAAAFDIISGKVTYPNHHPDREGVIADFFDEAMRSYICQPSATIIPRDIFITLGGFPLGMKIGEDLYLWIKLASNYNVCFTPEALVLYNRTAPNRSVGIYTPEHTDASFEDFYHPAEGNSSRNEYIARCAIGKALTLSAKGDSILGRRTELFFAYTTRYRLGWRKLWVLNRIPPKLRPYFYSLYNQLAWAIARKGF